MTALNGYWKHWESYGISPENKILAPHWEKFFRELFHGMDAEVIDLARALCALRVWTDSLAEYAVPKFDKHTYDKQGRSLENAGAVRMVYLEGKGRVYRFDPAAAQILREEYDADNKDLCSRVRFLANKYFRKVLDTGDEGKFYLPFWADIIARLTDDPAELADQYERYLSSYISYKDGQWPNREIIEMVFIRISELATSDTVAYAFFEHKMGASLFFSGRPNERLEGYKHLRAAYDILSDSRKRVSQKKLLPVLHDLAFATKDMGRMKDAADLMERYARCCRKVYEPGDDRIIEALRETGTLMMTVGRFSDCMKISEETLKIRRETIGDNADITRQDMMGMSIAYEKAGRQEEAEALRKQILKAEKKTVAYYHSHTDEIKEDLLEGIFQAADRACYLLLRGNRKGKSAARKIQEQLLEICGKLATIKEKRFSETNTLDLLDALSSRLEKSWALSRENILNEALDMRKTIIEQRLSVCHDNYKNMPENSLSRQVPWSHYNMEDSWIADHMEKLAADLERAGRSEEARELFHRVLDIHEELRQGYIGLYGVVHGSSDEDALPHLEKIIDLTRGQGRDEENLELRKYTIVEYKRQCEDKYTSPAVRAMRAMASDLDAMGRTEEAEWIRDDILASYRRKAKTFGEKSVENMEEWADELHRSNRPEEELAIRRTIRAMRQSIWGEDDKDTIRATDKLASVLHDMKAYAEELPLREDLFDQTKKNYGADSQETIYAMMRKAQALLGLRRYKKAASLWLKIAESRTKNLSEIHALLSRHLAAYTLAADGKAKEALIAQRKTMELFREDNPLFMEADREGGSLVSANVFLEAVLVTILCEMLAFMEGRDEEWVPKLREAALDLFADIQDCCGGRSPFEKKPYYDPYSEEKPKEQTTYRRTYFFFHDEVGNLLWDMYDELKKAGHTKAAQDAHRRMGNLIMLPFTLAAAALDSGRSETQDALHRAWELGTAEWGREDIKAMEEPDERDEE